VGVGGSSGVNGRSGNGPSRALAGDAGREPGMGARVVIVGLGKVGLLGRESRREGPSLQENAESSDTRVGVLPLAKEGLLMSRVLEDMGFMAIVEVVSTELIVAAPSEVFGGEAGFLLKGLTLSG
jgi:hypothetical protein